MAGEAAVEVTDEGVVEIEVTDLETEIAAGEKLSERTRAPAASVVDQAADALTDAAQAAIDKVNRDATTRVRAAEATATAERTRADNTARVLRDRDAELASVREQATASQITALTQSIAAAQQSYDAATAAFEAAHEAGNAKAMAKANGDIAKAASALDRLGADKAALEAAPKPAARTVATDDTTADAGSPLENYIAVAKFSPRAASWMRAHPECAPAAAGGDPVKNAAMMEGHYAALRANIPANSDKYFEMIEARVNGTDADTTGEVTAAQPVSRAATTRPAQPAAAAQRRPMPSAPVTRDAPDAAGRPQKTTVTLSKAQQEIAWESFPAKPGEDEETHHKRANGEYAHNLVTLRNEGKIGRTTH